MPTNLKRPLVRITASKPLLPGKLVVPAQPAKP